MATAVVSLYRLTCCKCSATTEVRPPIRRHTDDGWRMAGSKGWMCPSCLRLTCGDCGAKADIVAPMQSARTAANGWRFVIRNGLAAWRCLDCLKKKIIRGFASLSQDRRVEIAAKGGRVAHARGVAHQWTAEEASKAGKKGGLMARGGRGKRTPERLLLTEERHG